MRSFCVKLWFSGFGTTRFHNFFDFLRIGQFFHVFFWFMSHFHNLNSSHITLLAFKNSTIDNIKLLTGIDFIYNSL